MIQGGDFINEVIRIKEVNASKLYHKQIPDWEYVHMLFI
jgi:hypothetical protein